MTKKQIVPDEIKLEIHVVVDDLKRRLLGGNPPWNWVKPRLIAVGEGREWLSGAPTNRPAPKCDLAEERRAFMEKFYRDRKFGISLPKPAVSNREFAKRRKLGQELFYRPATAEVSYEAFMSAVGQSSHWTVTDQAERAKIVWEPTPTGYWFWAEVAADCPRLRTTWNSLNQAVRLFCLEEDVIVWHAYKFEGGVMIDLSTWSWLRTRFGAGALDAGEYDGQVDVGRSDAEDLSVVYDREGGRAAEVVKNAT